MDSSAARKILMLALLTATLQTTVQASKPELPPGEVLSVTAERGLDGVATHRFAIFTVQIGDVIFTASGKRIKHSTDNYQEGLNPGDKVGAVINGNDLILKKPNGGELKTKIIKRAPAQ
jgi:hypothetical protein